MKNFLVTLPLLISIFSFAQVNQDKKFGVSVNINSIGQLPSSGLGNIYFDSRYLNGGDEKDKSFSLGLNANYLITKDLALRIKGVLTKRNYLEYRDTRDIQSNAHLTTGRIDDVTMSESDFLIAPGIYYQYRKDIFGIYGGLDLEYIHHSKTKSTDIVTNISSDSSENYIIESSTTTPQGNSYGAGGFIGFNLFPTHFLSIGLEFSSALLHTKIGSTVYLKDITLKGNVPNFDDSYIDSIDRFRFTEVGASLNVSFWF